MMTYKRRDFLKVGGSFAAGMAILPMGCDFVVKTEAAKNTFGLLLYTLRDVIPADPKGILKQH